MKRPELRTLPTRRAAPRSQKPVTGQALMQKRESHAEPQPDAPAVGRRVGNATDREKSGVTARSLMVAKGAAGERPGYKHKRKEV